MSQKSYCGNCSQLSPFLILPEPWPTTCGCCRLKWTPGQMASMFCLYLLLWWIPDKKKFQIKPGWKNLSWNSLLTNTIAGKFFNETFHTCTVHKTWWNCLSFYILSEGLITLENSLITDPILLSWLVMAEVNKSGRLVNRVSFDT